MSFSVFNDIEAILIYLWVPYNSIAHMPYMLLNMKYEILHILCARSDNSNDISIYSYILYNINNYVNFKYNFKELILNIKKLKLKFICMQFLKKILILFVLENE